MSFTEVYSIHSTPMSAIIFSWKFFIPIPENSNCHAVGLYIVVVFICGTCVSIHQCKNCSIL